MGVRDTIYALASGRGRAGVAVVRVSGPGAGRVLADLSGGGGPIPRRARLARLADPASGSPIDEAVTLWFPGPGSFTGEDVAEFHVHGGPAVIESLFRAVCALGCRAAEPGEFTRRAFESGRLDLAQAEGLADLIAADSDSQRNQALRHLEGAWGRQIETWAARLTDASAWLEAGLDFPDEDDVPHAVSARAAPALASVADEIAAALAQGRRGEIVRDGLQVAIVGPPNAGKSTLLNALAGREAAIVSDVPGTTRDVIEVRLDLGGYVVVLADTAGLREGGDVVEREGIRRARARAEAADLRLFVADSSEPGTRFGLEIESLRRPGDVWIWSKADAVPPPAVDRLAGIETLAVSGLTGEGVDRLVARLTEIAGERGGAGEGALITQARHREALEACAACLARARAGNLSPELAAEEIRGALAALGRIVGRVDVEAVLDRVFSAFCIGK